MIDTKELRMIVQDFKLDGSPVFIQTKQMEELLDRLEAAENREPAAEWVENHFDGPKLYKLYVFPGAKGE